MSELMPLKYIPVFSCTTCPYFSGNALTGYFCQKLQDIALIEGTREDCPLKAWNSRSSWVSVEERPTVVCLCGSTRFWREFQRASLRETMAGKIVLSIGAASGTDDEHFGNLPREEYMRVKSMLDELHKRKIDLADEVLILNVSGYIGESTRSELEYAEKHGKKIRYLEPAPPSITTEDKGDTITGKGEH